MQQVPQRDAQPIAIDTHVEILRHRRGHGDLSLRGELRKIRDRVRHFLAQRERFRRVPSLGAREARGIEHVRDHPLQAAELDEHAPYELAALDGGRVAQRERLQRQSETRDRTLELVGHAGEELFLPPP